MVYIYFGFNELSDIGNVRKKNVKRFGTFCLCKKHIIILPERIQCNIGHTRFIRYFSCAYTLILETVFSCLACKSGNALFCLMVKIYVGSTPLIIFLALIVFLINASKPQMIFLLGGFFLLLLYLYLIMYDRGGMITEIYKIFFKSRGLASDHAEIYLKDKNESVISGKLIFDDGKYAYVEFDRTYSNCIGVGDSCIKTIRKKVPSEDVSIITKVKKDTKASVPK